MENENTNPSGERTNENSEQLRVLSALERWGRYPEKKGKTDFEIIKCMEEEIPKEESVKFAYFGPVGFSSPYDESIQKKNNDVLKTTVQVKELFVLTDKKIYLKCSNKHKEKPALGMAIGIAYLKDLKFVYDKKMLSVGQVQFFLAVGVDEHQSSVITLMIMKDVYHMPAKKHYENFKSELEEAVNFNASVYYLVLEYK